TRFNGGLIAEQNQSSKHLHTAHHDGSDEMRVGLFGGSFNPIHFGHLRAAEEVREMLKLDLVYFVPASSPPHKPEGELAPDEHRLQMVRLATKGNRHFMVSDVEIR